MQQSNVGRGKRCGKSSLFPSKFYYSSALEQTEPSSETIFHIEKSSADLQPCKDLIKSLPKLEAECKGEVGCIIIDGQLRNLYNCLKRCYRNIHMSYDFYKNKDANDDPNGPIIFNEKLFEFQKEVENRFYCVISIMTNSLKKERIYSKDYFSSCIEVKSKKELLSYTEKLYCRPNSSDSEVESIQSEEEATETDTNKNTTKENSSNNNNNNNNNEDSNNDNDDDRHLNSIVMNSYISNFNILGLNKMLTLFNKGEFKDEFHYSYSIADVESSTVISYKFESENCKDHLICEFAFAKFDNVKRAHVLQLKNIVVETGFYLPITAMYFHHDDKNNTNKLYLCGDIRIKEFTIEDLDKIGCENYQDEIQIFNSNTFYFGECEYESSVITVWEDELVFGCGSNLFIWDIKNENDNKKKTIKIEKVRSQLKDYDVDIEKVDFTQGKLCKINSIQVSYRMHQISSLEVIKGPSSNETFLAVSSLNYPVIYIYNKKHENISRLVSHTMSSF